jgi:hypothetical protein
MAHIYPVKIIGIMLCGKNNLNLSSFDYDPADGLARILERSEQAESRLFEFGRRHLLTPARRAGLPRDGPLKHSMTFPSSASETRSAPKSQ